MLLGSTYTMADMVTYYEKDNVNVSLAIDDFGEEKPLCMLTFMNGLDHLSIYGGPQNYALYGNVNNLQTAGILIKVDDNKIYKFGQSSIFGKIIYAQKIDQTILNEIEKGKQVKYRIYPSAHFYNQKTHIIKSERFGQAVGYFKRCLADIPNVDI